jgi:hypothetical protein
MVTKFEYPNSFIDHLSASISCLSSRPEIAMDSCNRSSGSWFILRKITPIEWFSWEDGVFLHVSMSIFEFSEHQRSVTIRSKEIGAAAYNQTLNETAHQHLGRYSEYNVYSAELTALDLGARTMHTTIHDATSSSIAKQHALPYNSHDDNRDNAFSPLY